MKASLKALILAVVASAACGSPKPKTQGKVTGEHLACKPMEMHGRFDCASVLRDFLHANRDARIAGVNVIYGQARAELLVWRTESDGWPKASTLEIDSHECSPKSGNDPDCATVIDDLTDAKPAKHHYFIVPVYGAPDAPAHPGSWSVLDVRAASATASSDVGWDSVRTELVPCRVEPGEPFLIDLGEGVLHAVGSGSGINPLPKAIEAPFACEPALINYLRAHPDQRIADVVALDGVLTKRIGDRDELGKPGTITLMVLLGPSPSPTARKLSVRELACVDGNCVAHHAGFRPQLEFSPRVVFAFPIYDADLDEGGAGSMILVSLVE